MKEEFKNRINELKAEIDAIRPLDKETEMRIWQKFRLDWNFHSNNIEGNSLTFGETKSFLLHGITADGKPLKDHLEIKGHNEVLISLDDVVKENRPLTESFIRELHKLILNEPYQIDAITSEGKPTKRTIEAGKYKSQPNHVKTATSEIFYFAKPEETAALMDDLINKWYRTAIESKSSHPAEIAALLHYKFIRIHPFDDGNGRISRILMNLILMKFGFPPVIVKTQKKEDYYRALRQADGGDESYFVNYIAELLIDSLNLYLRGAKGENIEEEEDIDKEIALFKSSIKRDNKISTFRTVESQTKVLNAFILPLFDRLLNKLMQFDEIFNIKNHSFLLNGGKFANEIASAKKYLVNGFKSLDFKTIDIESHWKDLISSPKGTEHIRFKLRITLNKGDFQVDYIGKKLVKGYFEEWTDADINDIVNKSIKSLIAEIEKYNK